MPTSASPKKQSKSDFIRQQPASMTAAEVVAKAKAEGIKLSGNLVYMVRGTKGSKAGVKKAASTRGANAKKATPKKNATSKEGAKASKKATSKKTSTTASPGTAKSAGTSKSAFIRLHPSLTAAEVIAAGKAQGLSFSSALVYAVRGAKGAKSKAKTTVKTTSKKAAPKKGTESKADFVRARTHLSPKEIVEDAKAKGIKLDVNYVYTVRAEQKKSFRKEARAKAVAGTASSKTTSIPKRASNGSRPVGSVEDLLRAAAAELGLGRAMEILQGERARVRAVLGG